MKTNAQKRAMRRLPLGRRRVKINPRRVDEFGYPKNDPVINAIIASALADADREMAQERAQASMMNLAYLDRFDKVDGSFGNAVDSALALLWSIKNECKIGQVDAYRIRQQRAARAYHKAVKTAAVLEGATHPDLIVAIEAAADYHFDASECFLRGWAEVLNNAKVYLTDALQARVDIGLQADWQSYHKARTRAVFTSVANKLLWDEYELLMHTEDISGWYEIWERDY